MTVVHVDGSHIKKKIKRHIPFKRCMLGDLNYEDRI